MLVVSHSSNHGVLSFAPKKTMWTDAIDLPSRINLPAAGRGLPGGKSLFLFRQEKGPKEGDPDIPDDPDTQRCLAGGAELAPLLLSLF